MNHWEYIATGVNAGVFDLEVFNKLTGGAVIAHYTTCAPFVRRVRQTDPHLYDQLESLIDKLIVIRTLSEHRLDARSKRRLRRRGIPGSLLAAIFSDPETHSVRPVRHSPRAVSYHELDLALAQAGYDWAKAAIAAETRTPIFEIRWRGPDQTTIGGLQQTVTSARMGEDPVAQVGAFRGGAPVAVASLHIDRDLDPGLRASLAAASAETPPESLCFITLTNHRGTERGTRELSRLLIRNAARYAQVPLGKRPAVVTDEPVVGELAQDEGATIVASADTVGGATLAVLVF
jgi:hypothetical protein